MNRRHLLTLMGSSAAVSACSRFATYTGPEVTRLEVYKDERALLAYHHSEVLAFYDMELGFAPTGHKTQYGDGRTPEGDYIIDRRNPNSAFYLSLGISYPNEADVAQARARGVDPGGDIFIHGTTFRFRGQDDWTAGCIAITNWEMRELYSMVAVGTPISLYA